MMWSIRWVDHDDGVSRDADMVYFRSLDRDDDDDDVVYSLSRS